jgi:hypothetical protein
MPRPALLRSLTLLAVGCALVTPAAAQSVNVDVANASGTPSASYGAGAAQAGFWNAIDASSLGTPFPLQGLGGAAAGVSVSYQLFGNGLGNFSFNHVGTAGDDQALLDDLQDIGSGSSLATWNFTGLNAGTYTVYTYAWAPDDPLNSSSKVKVVGSADPEQTLGGAWPGAHALGVTYARHVLVVGGAGQLVVEVRPSSGFGSVNGIQLVEGGGGGGPAKFCTSKPSSLPGCTPTLDGTSTTVSKSAGAGSHTIDATPVPGGAGLPGILIYTETGLLGTPVNTQFGFLCLDQFSRLGNFPQSPGGTSGQCNGSYVWDFGAIVAATSAIAPGDTLHLQGWYRDPPSAGAANFTEGIGPIAVVP